MGLLVVNGCIGGLVIFNGCEIFNLLEYEFNKLCVE